MLTPYSLTTGLESTDGNPVKSNAAALEEDSRPTQLRIRIRIPKEYQNEPVISRLITACGLTVNVNAALLGSNIKNDGWFDLDLKGSKAQIDSGLIYLNDLDVEIWSKSTDPDEENW